jgi:hypothetical protein
MNDEFSQHASRGSPHHSTVKNARTMSTPSAAFGHPDGAEMVDLLIPEGIPMPILAAFLGPPEVGG